MKRTGIILLLSVTASVMLFSCTREDRFDASYESYEMHTEFNISVASNTKAQSAAASDTDSQAVYEAEKSNVFIDSNLAFGLVGIDNESKSVMVDDLPVYEKNGVRCADLFTSGRSARSMMIDAFYPYVKNVNYHKDGSYVVAFTSEDIKKGPLASDEVILKCDNGFETVNLNFHHIANSLGFKVCDVTEDEQLQGLIHIRKVVLHGMPNEGMYVSNGDDSYWVPNAKHENILIFQGDEYVGNGIGNASFISTDRLTGDKEGCSRCIVVPEVLTEGRHYVEVIFDVDEFDYDGTHYRAVSGKSQKISLAGIIPDNMFEMGLQYTFVLGMDLGNIYRTIEFSASVEDWSDSLNGRVLEFDNE